MVKRLSLFSIIALLTLVFALPVHAQVATSSDPTGIIAGVTNIYQSYLGRAPDAQGLQYWLQSGQSLAQIKANILASSEYNSRITAINYLYQNLLGRPADTQGLNYWASSGKTVAQIQQDIKNTPEYISIQTVQAQTASSTLKATPVIATPVVTTQSTGTDGTCFVLTRNLGVGVSLTSSEAAALQNILTAEGVWSSGAITGYDENVAAAIVKLQGKLSISQTGFIGPITRAKLNATYGGKCATDSTYNNNYKNYNNNIVTTTNTSDIRSQVAQLYSDLLYRKPDQQGWDYWSNSGLSIDQVRQGFLNSPEYQTKQRVISIYQQTLGRAPTVSEILSAYDVAYANGFNTDIVRSQFTGQSTATQTQTQTTVVTPVVLTTPAVPAVPTQPTVTTPVTPAVTADAINSLYQTLLYRSADAGGLAHWVNSGLDINGVSAAIQQTPEYRNIQSLSKLYLGDLNRQPDAGGIRYFYGLMENSGWSLQQVDAAIKASPEYAKVHSTAPASQASTNTSSIFDAFKKILGF